MVAKARQGDEMAPDAIERIIRMIQAPTSQMAAPIAGDAAKAGVRPQRYGGEEGETAA